MTRSHNNNRRRPSALFTPAMGDALYDTMQDAANDLGVSMDKLIAAFCYLPLIVSAHAKKTMAECLIAELGVYVRDEATAQETEEAMREYYVDRHHPHVSENDIRKIITIARSLFADGSSIKMGLAVERFMRGKGLKWDWLNPEPNKKKGPKRKKGK